MTLQLDRAQPVNTRVFPTNEGSLRMTHTHTSDRIETTSRTHSPRVSLVALNYGPEMTGIAAYTTDLAVRLAARGIEIQVVAGAPHYPGWQTWPRDSWKRHEKLNGVEIHRVGSYVPKDPTFVKRLLFEVLYGLRLGRVVPRTAEVVILPSPGLFTSGLVLAVLRLRGWQGHSILWMQDRYSAALAEKQSWPARIASRCVRYVESAVACAMDRVVVIHEHWKEEVCSDLDLRPENAVVIRNWTHIAPPPARNREQTRERLGWGSGEIIAMHAGNMGVKQGLENVIDAARIAQDKGLQIRFVLMGDGSQRAHLEEYATGINQIQFVSHLDDEQYAEALCAADALILNERPGQLSSAVPSKLTSYFMAGVPIIAATEEDGVAAAEVRASGAGVVLAPGQPETLLSALTADRLGALATIAETSGPAYVHAKLSAQSATDAFEMLINSLV